MALKDRWSRMMRKSVSSTSSSGGDGVNSTSNDEGDSLSKPPSRLAKTLTWRSANKTAASPTNQTSPTNKKKKAKEKPHPGERPLTEANMRHQELLSAFTMNFGRTRTSVGGRTSVSGISPGNSRQASVDAGYARRNPDRKPSAFANDAPQEEAETT